MERGILDDWFRSTKRTIDGLDSANSELSGLLKDMVSLFYDVVYPSEGGE